MYQRETEVKGSDSMIFLFTILGNPNEPEECQAAELFWWNTVLGSEDGALEMGDEVVR